MLKRGLRDQAELPRNDDCYHDIRGEQLKRARDHRSLVDSASRRLHGSLSTAKVEGQVGRGGWRSGTSDVASDRKSTRLNSSHWE